MMRCILGFAFLVMSAPIAKGDFFTFQEGVNGYVGTHDTTLSKSIPSDFPRGDSATVGVIGPEPTDMREQHGLVRFDGIFGAGANQISPGATVTSAILRLSTDISTNNTVFVHEMLQDWDEATATWDSFVNGVQTNGTEAAIVEVASFAPNSLSAFEIDVTSSVAKWSTGVDNLGWVFFIRDANTDVYTFHSSEAIDSALRPSLTVNIAAVPEPNSWFLLAIAGGAICFRRRHR